MSDERNQAVTRAVMDAEDYLQNAVRAWRKLRDAERALIEQQASVGRDAANQGYARAAVVADVLQALAADHGSALLRERKIDALEAQVAELRKRADAAWEAALEELNDPRHAGSPAFRDGLQVMEGVFRRHLFPEESP